jgi:hypothetical protein
MAARKAATDSAWPNRVGLAAYGLWGRMQAIMATGRPYGHLTDLDGTPMAIAELARIVGERSAAVQGLLDRLVAAGALDFDGELYSEPGMIQRKTVSILRSNAGRRGADVARLRQPAQHATQHPDATLPQQKVPEPHQAVGPVAEGTSVAQDLSGKTGSTLTPSTTSSSTAHAKENEREAQRRAELLDRLEKSARVQALITRMPDPEGDKVLVYEFLLRVAIRLGDAAAFGWLSRFEQTVNPEGMGYRPVPPNVFVAALANYVALGFLDKPDPPEPKHFQSFVEAMRDEKSTVRLQRGPAGVRKAAKEPQALDPTGNQSAAARLTRDLGDADA